MQLPCAVAAGVAGPSEGVSPSRAERWAPEAVQRTEPKAAADEIGRFSDQLIPKTKSKMAPRQIV